MRIVRAINERGLYIGQDHHNAKHTDAEVELMRRLHEDGMSYQAIADKFECGKATVADYCTYRRRAQVPTGYRTIHLHE